MNPSRMLRELRGRGRSLWSALVRSVGAEQVPRARRRATAVGNIGTLLGRDEAVVILDVGANIGQSIRAFRSAFPRATIHSFEPSPRVFSEHLENGFRGVPGVHLWNLAVGAAEGRMALGENSASVMSSFLRPGGACWGEVVRTTEVPVTTLDAFAAREGIGFIHLLKSDTQGFDLEVLKGAEGLLRAGRIGIIHVEICCAALYEGQPSLDAIHRHLADRGFAVAGFYKQRIEHGLLGWMDALFVSRAFHAERHRRGGPRIERLG